MSLLTVRHLTTYRYRHPVAFGEHRMMFRPRDSHDQRLLAHTLLITPKPAALHWTQDVFGNSVTLARFTGRSDRLVFESTLHLEHVEGAALALTLPERAQCFPIAYDADEMPDLLRSIERQMPDPGHVIGRWARSFLDGSAPGGVGRPAAGHDQDDQPPIHLPRPPRAGNPGPAHHPAAGDGHVPRLRPAHDGGSPLARDGRAIRKRLSPRARPPQSRGGGAARRWHNTHAWLQVYLPGAGWVEFDPTNGIVGSRGLIRVAVVRDPATAIPLSGSWTGAAGDCLGMDVSVHVTEAAPGATVGAAPAILAVS